MPTSRTLIAVASLVAALATPSVTFAQQLPTALEGDRVRVWMAGADEPVIGTLTRRNTGGFIVGGMLGTLVGGVTGTVLGFNRDRWSDATPPSALAKPQLSVTLHLR